MKNRRGIAGLLGCLAFVCSAFVCLAFLSAVGIAAQTKDAPKNPIQFDAKFFQDLRWRSVGPPRAGRVVAVAGVPGEPEVYYFGSVGGGVWKTEDAGRTWNPIFDSQPVASIGAIAVAPSNPKIIYVGSGEADFWIGRSDRNGADGCDGLRIENGIP